MAAFAAHVGRHADDQLASFHLKRLLKHRQSCESSGCPKTGFNRKPLRGAAWERIDRACWSRRRTRNPAAALVEGKNRRRSGGIALRGGRDRQIAAHGCTAGTPRQRNAHALALLLLPAAPGQRVLSDPELTIVTQLAANVSHTIRRPRDEELSGGVCQTGSRRSRAALKKPVCGCCGRSQKGWYDHKVRRVRDLSCGDTRIFLELEVRRVDCRRCGRFKREQLDFLADNPLYTKRFAYAIPVAKPIERTTIAKSARTDSDFFGGFK
jgi:hypothetical protein